MDRVYLYLSNAEINKCNTWIPELHEHFSESTKQRIETLFSLPVTLPLEIAAGVARRTPSLYK